MENEFDFESAKKKLAASLKKSRFEHSLNVMDVSCRLARVYGADLSKAKIAGLMHDCAKGMSIEEMLKVCVEDGIYPDDMLKKSGALLHAAAGAVKARRDYGVDDTEILEAICWHTTGRPEMTLLEKIVFIADYIEPLRKFEGVERIREQAFSNIDLAIVTALNGTIEHLEKNGEAVYDQSLRTRNYYAEIVKSR